MTSALPYGNGEPHFGHVYEFIITDIMARFYRLTGRDVIYVCATDAHGTPIEINAMKAGKDPLSFVMENHEKFKKMFEFFLISLDNYHITHSEENEKIAHEMFKKALENGYIYTKEIDLLFCEKCNRFLPDRYVRGTCPKCGAEDQYGDVCEKCGATYTPFQLKNPKCALCGSKPVIMKSKHYFFKLSAFEGKLKAWIQNAPLQQEVKNYVLDWIEKGLEDWCISRDGPYFGFKVPGEENKYLYVWWDAPIGYIASTANYCKKAGCDWEKIWKGTCGEFQIVHTIGKDIIYFHYLFWPAMLMATEFKLPTYIHTHGFLTVNGEKMSKSRGTFITAKDYMEKIGNPEYLRFYFASHTSSGITDIDLSREAFLTAVNSVLVGNIMNFVYRALTLLYRYFEGKTISASTYDMEELVEVKNILERIREAYENWNIREVVECVDGIASIGNAYLQKKEPWKLVRENKEKAHEVIAQALNMAKDICIALFPILPSACGKALKIMNLEESWNLIGKELENGHIINKPEPLIPKIEDFQLF